MADWKKILGAVAPVLASAIGGPLAGTAVSALSAQLLGKPDATQDEVAAAVVAATPADLMKLTQAELDFKKAMSDANVDLERIAAADRASARDREVKAADVWTPRILAALVLGGFLGSLWAVLSGRVHNITDPLVSGLIGTMIGYASAKADQVISYYFGSSASSKAKDETLSKIATGP